MPHTDLHTFNFSGLELRVIMRMDEPWFALTDVNRVLYGKTQGLSWVTKRLSDDERTKCDRTALGMSPGQRAVLVSESGLYKLIMRSDKPSARSFQDWVTREVLPSIRKTGGYLLNEQARDTAHASDRQAMPLPEEFAQLFAKVLEQQAETNQLLAKLLAEREADRKEAKAVKKDTRMIAAAVAKERFGLRQRLFSAEIFEPAIE